MSWIDPVRRLLRPLQVRHVEPKPDAPEPESPSLALGAQSTRILQKAAVYRLQFQREAAARARAQQDREQQEWAARQEAWEDELARGLALRQSHFPGDGDEPRTPAPETWEGEGGIRWFRFRL